MNTTGNVYLRARNFGGRIAYNPSLKGNSVQDRSCSRNCKLSRRVLSDRDLCNYYHCSRHAGMGRGTRASQETCPDFRSHTFGIKGRIIMETPRCIRYPLLCLGFTAFAQQTPIPLDSVLLVADKNLDNFTNSQQVLTLSDSVIRLNQASLTGLLDANTSIYFKENGAGMVSSPSFRGTTAQQTAVIWNGININSRLNGQTDFNTITTRVFDGVSVRSGGGGVLYGSGAIGGTIHLIDALDFIPRTKNLLQTNYGSFDSYGLTNTVTHATSNFSGKVAVNRTGSDNDYDLFDAAGKNLNGQFYNNSLSVAAAVKLDKKNNIRYYGYAYDGRRNFSLVSITETRTKYRDLNTRNLLEWQGDQGRLTSNLKLAFLTERYRYYPNIARETNSEGQVNTWIAAYDAGYAINEKTELHGILNFENNKGEGSSIAKTSRSITALNLLFKQRLGSGFIYEATARKEFTSNYKAPFVYALGGSYKCSDFYTLSINGSKNFRIPTFNDLYWESSGNALLKPETSHQAEVGNTFTHHNLKLSLTGYYIDLRDMIRWLPSSGDVWVPINTDRVRSYGAEAQLGWQKTWGLNRFSLTANYAYTVSKDVEKDKFLTYVPMHKGTANLGFARDRFSAYYQWRAVGEVYTASDNDSRFNIDAYTRSDLGFEYSLGTEREYVFGFQVHNIYNTAYQSVANRELPGRNFNIYLNLNF